MRHIVALMVALFITSAAYADFDQTGYAGIALLFADSNDGDLDSEQGGELFAGYGMDSNIALELGYIDKLDFDNAASDSTVRVDIIRFALIAERSLTDRLLVNFIMGGYQADSEYRVSDIKLDEDSSSGFYGGAAMGLQFGGMVFSLQGEYYPEIAPDISMGLGKLAVSMRF